MIPKQKLLVVNKRFHTPCQASPDGVPLVHEWLRKWLYDTENSHLLSGCSSNSSWMTTISRSRSSRSSPDTATATRGQQNDHKEKRIRHACLCRRAIDDKAIHSDHSDLYTSRSERGQTLQARGQQRHIYPHDTYYCVRVLSG